MRLIIAGTRRGVPWMALCNALEEWMGEYGEPTCVLCGEARGVDQQGKLWARERGILVQSYPANWSRGRMAGPIRNARTGAPR